MRWQCGAGTDRSLPLGDDRRGLPDAAARGRTARVVRISALSGPRAPCHAARGSGQAGGRRSSSVPSASVRGRREARTRPSVGPMRTIPRTDLTVSDLCLGGNVFGWTADEPTSFAVLDRFLDATPSTLRPFVDTAESYNAGRSEQMIGDWMSSRGVADRVRVATKASRTGKEHPLAAAEIRSAAERSLRNLRVDTIDLYYAH